MLYSLNKMKIKIEDIIFWILILGIVALVIWKLFGSPSDIATIISLASFLTASTLTLLIKIHNIERKTEVGFMNVMGDLNAIKIDTNYIKKDINKINNKLGNIGSLIRRIK